MIKIVTIVGARPQFVKAAAVSRIIAKEKGFKEIIVHTGQHFDPNMSDIFFKEMKIKKPNYNLNINSLGHGAMTGKMLEEIEKVLIKEKPDYTMVYGDTNSTIAGALAAKKLHIKVIHVEAGLRSFNIKMPEEVNRILTDRISDILFCPTQTAVDNLHKEGYKNLDCKVYNNGDVMQDAAIFYSGFSAKKSKIIKTLGLEKFILCTLHRAENTDHIPTLKSLVATLNKINKETRIVVPIHPRTKGILAKNKIKTDFTILNPVGYFDMIELIKHSQLVMTDSGGLQKEAFFFQKHCVTLREQTEWVELVKNGFNVVAGTNPEKVYKAYKKMLRKKSDFSVNLYGNGNASKRLVRYLKAR